MPAVTDLPDELPSCLQRRHPSSLNRFLSWSIWGQDDVNDARLEALKAEGDLQGKGWLIIDDTLDRQGH